MPDRLQTVRVKHLNLYDRNGVKINVMIIVK